MVRAEQIGVEPTETSESLRDNLSNRLVLHVALGQFDADVKPEKGKPIKIHENSLTALKNQNTAVREIDAEVFGERYKREKLTEGKKEEEITKDEIRDAQFLTWAKYASEEIIRGFQKDVALKIYVELGLIKDITSKPQAEEVMKMFYDTTSQKPGEFYNNFCGTDMNEALAEKLTTDDMLIIKPFLVKWMVGSEKAFNALLVLRATQDRLAPTTPDAELIPQDQSVTGLEKQVLEFYREGWEMEGRTQQPTHRNANNNDTTTQQAPARPDNTPKQKPPEPLPEATRNPNKQEPTQEQRDKIFSFLLHHPEDRKLLLNPEYDVLFTNALTKPQIGGENISDLTPLFIELGNGLTYRIEQNPLERFTQHNTICAYVIKEERKELHHIFWTDRWNIKRIFTESGEIKGTDGSIKPINNETIFDRDQYILDHPDLFLPAKASEGQPAIIEPAPLPTTHPTGTQETNRPLQPEVKTELDSVEQLIAANKISEANTRIDSLVNKYASQPHVQSALLLEKGLIALKDMEAYRFLESAIDLDSTNGRAYFELAKLLSNEKRRFNKYQDALTLLEDADAKKVDFGVYKLATTALKAEIKRKISEQSGQRNSP